MEGVTDGPPSGGAREAVPDEGQPPLGIWMPNREREKEAIQNFGMDFWSKTLPLGTIIFTD